jgi:hypothetical protein
MTEPKSEAPFCVNRPFTGPEQGTFKCACGSRCKEMRPNSEPEKNGRHYVALSVCVNGYTCCGYTADELTEELITRDGGRS